MWSGTVWGSPRPIRVPSAKCSSRPFGGRAAALVVEGSAPGQAEPRAPVRNLNTLRGCVDETTARAGSACVRATVTVGRGAYCIRANALVSVGPDEMTALDEDERSSGRPRIRCEDVLLPWTLRKRSLTPASTRCARRRGPDRAVSQRWSGRGPTARRSRWHTRPLSQGSGSGLVAAVSAAVAGEQARGGTTPAAGVGRDLTWAPEIGPTVVRASMTLENGSKERS